VDAATSDLLKPFDARQMCGFPVNTRINSVVNDDAECSRPVDRRKRKRNLDHAVED
jgi:hypothetical protein